MGRTMLLEVMPLLFAMAYGNDAPPHAPNFCERTFCLELQPMLQPPKKGYVKIEKLPGSKEQPSAVFRYGDLGSIAVHGPFPSFAKENLVSHDQESEEVVVHSCTQSGETLPRCQGYLILVSDNNFSTYPLVCSIVSFWGDAGKGERIVISAKLTQRCL
jgi:hypothetical protein